MQEPPGLFAYLGPDTTMPLMSIVATLVALILTFGRSALRFLVGMVERTLPTRSYRQALRFPHFRVGRQRISRAKGATPSEFRDRSKVSCGRVLLLRPDWVRLS